MSRCARTKQQQTSLEILIYRLSARKGDTNLTKREGSSLHSVQIVSTART